MISFLAPLALFAASLLAIPIILHLFKPRRVRQTPFSSLRWLHLSQQKLARRIKWHQVLLFILRAAFLLFLVLALAKPMWSPKTGGGVAERFVILDVSRGMGYQVPGRPTPLERGKEVAAQIATRGIADDRTSVMLTSSSTRLLGPLTRDPEGYLPALQAAQVSMTDADLSSALQVIRPMLAHRRPGTQVELYFITDNHQQSWRQSGIAGFVKDLGITAQVKVIDVGIVGAQNAWIGSARLIETAKPPRRAIRVQVGSVGDAAQQRVLRVSGLVGLPELTRTIKVESGEMAREEIELPVAYDTAGKVAKINLGPADALASDDEYFLNLDSGAGTKVLLVEADSTQIESLRPGYYLRAALGALSAAESRPIHPINKTSADVKPEDFAAADAVILADVPQLSDACLAALEARVKSGVGLAIFLGPDVQPAFYNTKLYKPLLLTESLLPAEIKTISPVATGLAAMGNIHWSHPMLAPLFDPVLGDLGQTHFRTYYQLGDAVTGTEVLASIGDTSPAIMERPVGSGKVILFNTTANDAWSDLPRRKSFVPLIDRLVAHLVGGGVRRTFDVGETVVLPLPDVKAGTALTVVTPRGDRITPVLQTEAGRSMIRIESVQEPGVYRVEPVGVNFIVQVGRGDSAMIPADAAVLKKWWEPMAMQVISPEVAIKDSVATQGRIKLWPWFVGLACLAFLAEMFFVHWLCPRMNPDVIASEVPRRGMFSVHGTDETKATAAMQQEAAGQPVQ